MIPLLIAATWVCQLKLFVQAKLWLNYVSSALKLKPNEVPAFEITNQVAAPNSYGTFQLYLFRSVIWLSFWQAQIAIKSFNIFVLASNEHHQHSFSSFFHFNSTSVWLFRSSNRWKLIIIQINRHKRRKKLGKKFYWFPSTIVHILHLIEMLKTLLCYMYVYTFLTRAP